MSKDNPTALETMTFLEFMAKLAREVEAMEKRAKEQQKQLDKIKKK